MKRYATMALLPLSLLLLFSCFAAAPALAVKTTLCKQQEEQCKNRYAAIAFEATVTLWELETNKGPVTCGQATIKGKTTAESGEPLPGEITAQELAKCSINVGGKVTACGVASAVNVPYSATLAWKAFSNDGQWRWKSSGKGDPGFKLECGLEINCTFTVTEPVTELFGGAPAGLGAKQIEMARAGMICPTSAKWTGVWSFTTPNPLYVGFV